MSSRWIRKRSLLRESRLQAGQMSDTATGTNEAFSQTAGSFLMHE